MLSKSLPGTCVLALLLSLSLTAQEAEVHGAITDTEGNPLIGATVRVIGSVIGASSDIDGYYELEVPPGRIRLLYSYIGFENFDTILRVRPDEREIEIDVVMPDAFNDIPEVIVFGRRATGQAQALRNQQSALMAQTVVHSEVFNQYPDLTIAETAARMPGVSIIRNTGDGEVVQVRGLPEQFTAVTLNGQRLPTIQPEADQSGSLEIIPTLLVEEVRVIKARSADMDGDATAGTVDFRIRTPEERFEVLAQAGVGNNLGFDGNPDQYRGITQLAGAINSELADEKVYALAAGSFLRQGRGTRTKLIDYGLGDLPANQPYAARPFDANLQTDRVGFVGAVELRPSIYNRMRLSYNHSSLGEDIAHRHLFATNLPQESEVTRITSKWRKRRKLSLVALEVENNFPKSRLDYQLSFSINQEDLLDRGRLVYNAPAQSGAFSPEQLVGLVATDAVAAAPLEGRRQLQDNISLEEDVAIGSLNYTRYLNQKKNGFLRVGARYRSKDRLYATFTPQLTGPGPDAPAVISPGTFAPIPTRNFAEVPDLTIDNLDYGLKQRIAAGYGMYAANITTQLSLSAGLRYEYLEVENIETDRDTINFDRSDLLPSVNLTYRVRRDRQFRFSYHKSLARPNYATYRSNLSLPLIGLDQFSRGNPDITTTESHNLDLTFERYGRRDGIFSVGLYAKFLDNPTLRDTETVLTEGRATYGTTLVNIDRASLLGAEIGLVQNLGFLGGNLRYLNVNGNYNLNLFSTTDAVYDLPDFTLPQAPRQTGNLSIVVNNPNSGLNVVLAANFRDRIFDRLLDDRPLYRNSFVSLDFAADYEVVKDISVYVRVNNLTDHAYEEWYGKPNGDASVIRSVSNYGTWGLLGVRFQPR